MLRLDDSAAHIAVAVEAREDEAFPTAADLASTIATSCGVLVMRVLVMGMGMWMWLRAFDRPAGHVAIGVRAHHDEPFAAAADPAVTTAAPSPTAVVLVMLVLVMRMRVHTFDRPAGQVAIGVRARHDEAFAAAADPTTTAMMFVVVMVIVRCWMRCRRAVAVHREVHLRALSRRRRWLYRDPGARRAAAGVMSIEAHGIPPLVLIDCSPVTTSGRSASFATEQNPQKQQMDMPTLVITAAGHCPRLSSLGGAVVVVATNRRSARRVRSADELR
jgi:hypothetical protein